MKDIELSLTDYIGIGVFVSGIGLLTLLPINCEECKLVMHAFFLLTFFLFYTIKKSTINLSKIDFLILSFLSYSFLSFLWAESGPSTWLYSFNFLLFYLTFIFLRVFISKARIRLTSNFMLTLFILSSLYVLIVYSGIKVDNHFLLSWHGNFGENHNMVNVFLLVTSPYLLFYRFSNAALGIVLKFLGITLLFYLAYDTRCYGVFVSLVLLVGFYFYSLMSHSKYRFVYLLILSGIILSISLVYFSRISEVEAISSRLIFIIDAFQVFMANPFFGVGAGCSELASLQFVDSGQMIYMDTGNHNSISKFAANYGIVGLLLLVYISNRFITKIRIDDNLAQASIYSVLFVILAQQIYRGTHISYNDYNRVLIVAVLGISVITVKSRIQYYKFNFAPILASLSVLTLLWFSYSFITARANRLILSGNHKAEKRLDAIDKVSNDIFNNRIYERRLYDHQKANELVKVGRYQEAEEYYLRSISKSPHELSIKYDLAKLYKIQKDNENSFKYAYEVYQRDRDNFDNNLLLSQITNTDKDSVFFNQIVSTVRNDFDKYSLKNLSNRLRHNVIDSLSELDKISLLSLNNTTFEKTGNNIWGNSGFRSKNKLMARDSGWIETTIRDVSHHRIFGFAYDDDMSNFEFSDMDFGVGLSTVSNFAIYEAGVRKSNYFDCKLNDIITLVKVENKIDYLLNGVLIGSSIIKEKNNLELFVSMYSYKGSLTYIQTSF